MWTGALPSVKSTWLFIHFYVQLSVNQQKQLISFSKNEKDIILGWYTSNGVKALLDIESLTFKTFFFWNSLKEHKWQFSLKYQTFNIAEAKRFLQGEIEYFLGKLWIITLLKESSYSHFTFLYVYECSIVCYYSCIEMKKRVDDYQF